MLQVHEQVMIETLLWPLRIFANFLYAPSLFANNLLSYPFAISSHADSLMVSWSNHLPFAIFSLLQPAMKTWHSLLQPAMKIRCSLPSVSALICTSACQIDSICTRKGTCLPLLSIPSLYLLLRNVNTSVHFLSRETHVYL